MNFSKAKNLDIAMIQPPGWAAENPPLGLAMIKSALSQDGLAAGNFDLNILLYRLRHGEYADAWDLSNGYYSWGSESYVRQMAAVYSPEVLSFIYTVLSFQPKVIGLSAHWSSILWARFLARKFKQYAPSIKIVFGGPQTARYTKEWRELLAKGDADAIIFGEGEESLRDYTAAVKSNSLHSQVIPGVAYAAADRAIIDGGPRELIKSLDALPFADFADFDLELYKGHDVLPTYFSRGCINHCCYCTESQFFPRFRNRTGQRLFDEVVYQLKRYPQTKYFRLHDSVSNGNMRELESFCDLLLANKIKINFNLENAVIRKEMDARLYRKLRQAGCTLIGYGLETPSKKLLKQVGKAACLDADFERVVIDGAQSGMTIGLNMMFGLPGETAEDFQEQLDFIRKVKRYSRRILINPALNFCYFPEGCEAYSNPEKFGVDMTLGELYWESPDGENTFITRLSRFEEF